MSVQDADVALDLAGHRLDNFGQLVIGDRTGSRPARNSERDARRRRRSQDGYDTGRRGCAPDRCRATLDTTRVSLDSYAADMLSGTLVLAGGTLRADEVVVNGPRSTLAFNSGTMILDGGHSQFSTGSPIVIGNGTDTAMLTILSGDVSFSDWANGLTLAAGATLDLQGGSLFTTSFNAAPGSEVVWSGGEWACYSPLSLGDSGSLGPDLVLDADMRLGANGGLHVQSSGSLIVDGGTLSAQTLTHDAQAGLEYSSGNVHIDSGNIIIGAGEFTGQGGSPAVTLASATDRLSTYSGGLAVKDGYTLHLAAGSVELKGICWWKGCWTTAGQRWTSLTGALELYFGGENPGGLRIGSGSGDAVINGRTIVKVGPEGHLYVNGGSLRVDAGYELHLLAEESGNRCQCVCRRNQVGWHAVAGPRKS